MATKYWRTHIDIDTRFECTKKISCKTGAVTEYQLIKS